MAARARPSPQRVVWSLTPVGRNRVGGDVVAVREGGGKRWHEAEGGQGVGIDSSSFVHTTVYMEREVKGDKVNRSPLPALLRSH